MVSSAQSTAANSEAATCRSRDRARAAGHSLTEVLVVLTLLALTAAISSVAWNSYLSRTATMQAARIVRHTLTQARMLAVYRGLNHFVVFDPAKQTVSIYQDSSVPLGEFDVGDPRVRVEHWPATVQVALPPSTLPLVSPIDGEPLNAAWAIPAAAGPAWVDGLHGVLATPSGAIAAATLEPDVIRTGVIVFTDAGGRTVSLGIRGQFGDVQWFQLHGISWSRS